MADLGGLGVAVFLFLCKLEEFSLLGIESVWTTGNKSGLLIGGDANGIVDGIVDGGNVDGSTT